MSIPGAGSPLFLSAAAAEAAAFQVNRSLRFESGDSAKLTRTASTAGNRRTWTWSAWIKRGKVTSNQEYLFSAQGSGQFFILGFLNDDEFFITPDAGVGGSTFKSSAEFKDYSAWYHFVVAMDTTQSTASDRVKVYVNGDQITDWASSTYPSQNYDWHVNNSVAHSIGVSTQNTGYSSVYMAEIHHVDGTQLAASDFGEYDDNNVWQPKDCQSSLTYGTNGFYLKFADNSSNSALGTDSSGNNNDWTVNNITANSSALQSQTWSNNFTTTGNSGNWSTNATYKVENAFDGNDSTYAHANVDGAVSCAVTLSISPAIPCNSTVTFLGGVTSSGTGTIAINGGTATAFSTVGTNPTAANTATVSFSGDITSIVVTKTSTSANGLLIYGFEVDGVRLVDSGVAYTAAGDTDSLIDTPTNYTATSGNNGGNYATLNPIDRKNTNTVLSNGNLDVDQNVDESGDEYVRATIAVTSGKWYWEVTSTSGNYLTVGVADAHTAAGNLVYSGSGVLNYLQSDGSLRGSLGGGSSYVPSYGSSWSTGDVIGVALNMDDEEVTFYKNGSSQGTLSRTLAGKTITAVLGNGGVNNECVINFGQRPFSYTPPTGHLSLCTQNLPDPTIADGSTAMDIALYTSVNTDLTISGLNFSPDFVWQKQRSGNDKNFLSDIVRGAGLSLRSDTNAVEFSSNAVQTFNSDGWDITAGSGNANQNGQTYVGWAWDGGTSTVSNSNGSITSNVRASQTNGFSVVGYTGNGTAGATVGHGLNAAPEWIVIKNRDQADAWQVYHAANTANPETDYLVLDTSAATADATNRWNDTAPGASVFTLGSGAEVNTNTEKYIAYCWTSIAGYSSFGSYTGNQSNDGPFVFLGFRPRWVLIKSATTTAHWYLHDSERNPINPVTKALRPSLSDPVSTTGDRMQFLSNGFRITKQNLDMNANGATFVYAAFCEHPFKTARAR